MCCTKDLQKGYILSVIVDPLMPKRPNAMRKQQQAQMNESVNPQIPHGPEIDVSDSQ
jgi:hypothetical protein